MRFILTTPPSVEPIVLADAKLYLKLDNSTDDTLVTELITAARILCEEYTRRAFISQGWDLWLDHWPYNQKTSAWWDGTKEGFIGDLYGPANFIEIPKAPLLTINAINTYDESQTATLWDPSNYYVDNKSQMLPGRLILRTGAVWPVFVKSGNGIQISVTAGYGASGANVPATILQAIKQTIAHLYDNRGDQAIKIPPGAAALLNSYKVVGI